MLKVMRYARKRKNKDAKLLCFHVESRVDDADSEWKEKSQRILGILVRCVRHAYWMMYGMCGTLK